MKNVTLSRKNPHSSYSLDFSFSKIVTNVGLFTILYIEFCDIIIKER